MFGHRAPRVLDAVGFVVCTFDTGNPHDEDVANAELIVAVVNAAAPQGEE